MRHLKQFATDGGSPLSPSVGSAQPRTYRNLIATGPEAGRRRRGQRVIANVVTLGSSAPSTMEGIEFVFPGSGTTRRLFHCNGTLYDLASSGAANTVSTGWTAAQHMQFWGLSGAYLYCHQTAKRVLLRRPVTTTIEENYDLAAPVVAGVTVASSATAGSLVAGLYHAVYIVNENNTTGRQSGPIGPYTVLIAGGQTSYDINTLPATPSDTQFTHFKVYRTAGYATAALAAGATPLFSQRYVVGLAGTLVNNGLADSALFVTDPLPQGPYSDYYVGVTPAASTAVVGLPYRAMVLHFAGKQMYHTQPGFDDRWSANCVVDLPIDGQNILAAAEVGTSIIACTEREIITITGRGTYSGSPPIGDWVVERISTMRGVFNSKCLLSPDGATVYGLGFTGVWAYDGNGVRNLKKVIRDRRISAIPAENLTAALGFSAKDNTLWASIPTLTTTPWLAPPSFVAVYQTGTTWPAGFPNPVSEQGNVGIYNHSVTSFMRGGGWQSYYTGDTGSQRALLACDSWGNCNELDFGDKDSLPADSTAYTINTVASSGVLQLVTLNAAPGTAVVRGDRITVIPVDGTIAPETWVVVSVPAANQLTISTPSSLPGTIAGSVVYLGGILAMYETGAEFMAGSPDGGIGEFGIKQLRFFLNDLLYDESENAPLNPIVYAQIKIDDGDWGTRVIVFDGTGVPKMGETATVIGKAAASGHTKSGFSYRLRLICPVANRPMTVYGAEFEGPEGGTHRKAGG